MGLIDDEFPVKVFIDDSSDRVISGVQVYDRENGGVLVVPAGSSFPSTPEPGEFFWRTDQNILYRRSDANDGWDSLSIDPTIITHNQLQGLLNDDHPQYQTDARADTWLQSKDTDDLDEGGGNLYYTEARVSSNTDVSANTNHRNTTGNPHSTTAGDVGAIPTGQKGVANGVATLDGGGKVPTGQIPSVSLPEVYVVADATARQALNVQEGDEAIQTDDDSHWIWDGAAWQQRPGQAVPNDVFSAVDTAGGVSLDGGWTDIPLNVVNHETDGSFGFTGPSPDVTVQNSGVYVVTAYGSTSKTSGGDRSDSELRLLYDDGTGYVEVSGARVPMYNRNGNEGDTNASLTVALNVATNDRFKIQMRTRSGSSLESRANGSGLTLVSTRGQKGEKGDPGPGSSIALEDGGSAVSGGPFSTLNFVGGLVTASDAGGGKADVSISTPTKNDQEVTATSVASTTATSFTTMPGMSITVAETGDYLLMFSASLRPYQGTTAFVAVFVNGVQESGTQRRLTSPWFWPGAYGGINIQKTLSLTAGDSVEIQWFTPSDTVEVAERTLTIAER